MRALHRRVTIRIDSDCVEVLGSRLGRAAHEVRTVEQGGDAYAVLEDVLRTSRLLRPGRSCEVGVLLESPRTLYRTELGDGASRAEDGGFTVVLPEVVRDVLDPILARRRVHGGGWFAAGPALRAVNTMERRVASASPGRGIIVDRSSAAVTVLLVDGATIRWARGAPAGDPAAVAAVLLRRVGEAIDGRFGLHWWHLEDVANPDDARARRRLAREVEARCHALIGFIPRMAVSG